MSVYEDYIMDDLPFEKPSPPKSQELQDCINRLRDVSRKNGMLESENHELRSRVVELKSEVDAYNGQAAYFTSKSNEYKKLMRDVERLKAERDALQKEVKDTEEIRTLIMDMYFYVRDKFASAKFMKGLKLIQTRPEFRRQLTENLNLLDTWLAEMRQVVADLPEMEPEPEDPEGEELPFE